MPKVPTVSFVLAVAVLSAACSASTTTTTQKVAAPGAVVESGFLTDYSRLVASEQSPSVRFFRDLEGAATFRRLAVRPVAVWTDKGAGQASDEDLHYLADLFYQALEARLSRSFELVAETGPGVLEIDIGFTLVADPDGDIDHFVARVPAVGLERRSGALPEATGRFLRECLLEVEFRSVEATSAGAAASEAPRRPKKKVRAAFLDARRGGETPKAGVQTWEDVETVFAKWADSLDERLVALRDGTFEPRLTPARAAGSAPPR